jgi:hypothetical protein
MSKRDEFIAVADAQDKNGSGYVLGAQGQRAATASEAWVKKREHGNADNIKRVWAYIKKMLPTHPDMLLFDCSGYVLWCLAQIGILLTDTTANGIFFNMCVQISKSDLIVGDLVFKKYSTKNKMYHVGIYCGDGTVLHCKGRDVGVVREKISATGWNRFGRLKCLASIQEDDMRVNKNSSPEAIGAMQLLLFATGFPGKMDRTKIKKWGTSTEGALHEAQAAFGLPVKNEMDDNLFLSLAGVVPDEAADKIIIGQLRADLSDVAAYAAEKAKR